MEACIRIDISINRFRPAAAVEFLAGVGIVAPRADGAVVCGVVAAHYVRVAGDYRG